MKPAPAIELADSALDVVFVPQMGRAPLGFYGRGRLGISNGRLVLEGRCAENWRLWGPHTQISLPLGALRDLEWEDNELSLLADLDGQPATRSLKLRCEDDAARQVLCASLPDRRSPAFARQQAELQAFIEAASMRCPTVYISLLVSCLCIVASTLLVLAGAGFWEVDAGTLLGWGASYGPAIAAGQVWRLISAPFLHFGLAHLVFNLYALWQYAPVVERLYGSHRFGIIYMLSALAGGVCSLYWQPQAVSAGASGAIFGVFGALLAYPLRCPGSLPQGQGWPMMRGALLFVLLALAYGNNHEEVDNAAHLGGLLAGFAMGLILARPMCWQQSLNAKQTDPI